jgi:cytochrome c oxidase subunit 2
MGKIGRHVIAVTATLYLVSACTLSNRDKNDREVIKITASKFTYAPSVIELRKGVPVTLELISVDRIHGFKIPDLGLRADVLPGQSVRVELLPDKLGRYVFLCDIFCGSGHDEMNGVLIVKE